MIGFIDTSITITTNYNSSQSMTVQDSLHSDWTTNVFTSAVTDLVLIYVSVTSSASVVRWLTLTAEHSTTELKNCLTLLNLSLMLRPTVSRPVCLGIKHPYGAYDQILITLRQLRVC
jgi:hypothetical protein